MARSRKRLRPRRFKRKSVRSTIKRVEDPRFFAIGPHPSSPSPTPWYPFVVKIKFTSEGTLTVKDIVNYISTSWMPDSTSGTKKLPSLGFKFLSVRTWCRTSNTAFIMGTYPFISNLTWQTKVPDKPKSMWSKTAYPAMNQYARLGFKWPKSHQECVFYDDSQEHQTSPIIYLKPEGSTGIDILVYLYIVWTFNEAVSFTQPYTLDAIRLKDWILIGEEGAKDLSSLNIHETME